MSSRLAGNREKSLAKPVRWAALTVAAVVEAPPPETAGLRQALDEALAEADQLRGHVARHESALQTAEQTAYQRGLGEGRVQGRQEAAEQQKPVLDRMVRAIGDLAMLRPKLRMQSEAGLIRLCVAIAHRILKRELHMDPLALEGIVQAALSRVGTEELFRVRVHPRQADAIRRQLSRLGVPESVVVEPVASMDEGDVVVETGAGAIDASVNTQVAEVERGITARFAV